LSESETEISEDEVIQYYTENFDKIIEQFYDDEEETEEEIIEVSVSKSEMYNQLIEGYELALEIEMDEAKIKLYQDLIEGYQLALELEN
jgi:Mg2+ and Co2+ transporter CorA